MTILGYKGPTQPVTSTHLSLASTRHNLHDDATCTTRCRASTSLEAGLKNHNLTCFHVKQATRLRHMSCVDLHLLSLRRNQQTEVCMVLRTKSRNCRGDFEAQITKLYLPVLRIKPETRATDFEAKSGETVAIGFEAKPEKTVTTGFEVKP
jgi:hypothetical protein